MGALGLLSVVALQETRLNERELEAYRRAAETKGFKRFYMFGCPTTDGHGHRREHGGVCFLVDRRLQARLVASKQGVESQFLGLWLEDWFLGNCYAPPLQSQVVHPQHELCELFEEVLVESCVDGVGCLWVILTKSLIAVVLLKCLRPTVAEPCVFIEIRVGTVSVRLTGS